MVLGVRDHCQIISSNWAVKNKILCSFWQKVYKRVMPGLSPLACFVWYLQFKEAMKYDNFREWRRADKIQFCKLGKGREMYSFNTIPQLISNGLRFAFQYRQVQGSISLFSIGKYRV